MALPNIASGDIITSPQLPEPAKVIQVFPDGTSLRIMAVGVDSNLFYDRTYAPGEVTVRRVAQALVDVLPRGDDEKQRLEGFLYSGAAQDRGGTGPRPGATVQQSSGEKFGELGKVIRERRKGYGPG